MLIVFFDIGSPSPDERSVLFKVFIGEVGAATVILFYSIFNLKKGRSWRQIDFGAEKAASPTFGNSSDSLFEQIRHAGLTAVYTSRKDYAKYRPDTPSIDSYLALARQSIYLVSVHLTTGLKIDNVHILLKDFLEDSGETKVVISLLNPWQDKLISTMAPVLNLDKTDLAASIIGSIEELKSLKSELGHSARQRLTLRVHNTIPFGSAILLDHKSNEGRIQIETKPYKMPLSNSIAFEFMRSDSSDLFDRLGTSFEEIIRDGDDIEEMKAE